MIRELNKMTRAGMPESVRIASGSQRRGELLSKSDLLSIAGEWVLWLASLSSVDVFLFDD